MIAQMDGVQRKVDGVLAAQRGINEAVQSFCPLQYHFHRGFMHSSIMLAIDGLLLATFRLLPYERWMQMKATGGPAPTSAQFDKLSPGA